MFNELKIWKLCLIMLAIFTTVIASTAQELCEEITREIFEDTASNCSGAQDQNACYGYDSVSATFFEDVGDSFSGPSDLVEMLQLQTMLTSEYDPEEEEWGIGYFRVGLDDADDPLIVMTAGNVMVENDITAAENADINPMQAFNFTTGGPSQCLDAPNAVFIQGPQNAQLDLVINSTPIRIGSSVVVGTLDDNPDDNQPQDDTMYIAVLDGFAILNVGTSSAVTLNEGNVSSIGLTNENGETPAGNSVIPMSQVPVFDALTGEPVIGPDGQQYYRQQPYAEFTEPEPFTEDGTGIFDIETYTFVNLIPTPLLNYPVELEGEEEIVEEDPVPVVQQQQQAPQQDSPPEDVTECGSLNWCFEGEPWGDGRCGDPDPAVREWFFNAGWYQAQLECGAISEIPAQYQLLPVAPPVATGAQRRLPEAPAMAFVWAAPLLGIAGWLMRRRRGDDE